MTSAGRPGDWFDNPIFVKHVRSRLRKQPLVVLMVVVLVLCICIVWAGFQDPAFGSGGALGALLALQAIILVIIGASQVGAAVGGARASGILEFHRVSPLTPRELTLGFFFGAPIREYILFTCTLPFAFFYLGVGTVSPYAFVQMMVLLLASAWLFHGLALLNALLARARANPRGVVGLVVFVVIFGGNIAMSLSRGAPVLDMNLRLPFYGLKLPWLAVVLLHLAAVLYFIYLAARRKMAAERIHALSKRQSVAALATLAVLSVGSIWNREEYAALEVGTLYALVAAGIVLIMMVTPDRAEFEKGLWRAGRQGRAKLPWWDDLSLNQAFLLIACTIVLATATFASGGAVEPRTTISRAAAGSFPLAIAAGVLVVAYFGLAHQYFVLRFGARGKIYMLLFLFLAWILPLVAAMIVLLGGLSTTSSNAQTASQVIAGLSPIAGIAMTALVSATGSPVMGIQAATITPALFFAFVYSSLLVTARRRVYKAFSLRETGNAPS